MASAVRFATSQRKASEVAFILALLAGASALIIVLGGLLVSNLRNSAEPYLSGHSALEESPKSPNAPKLETRVEGNQSNIVEVDQAGQIVRVIHSSEIQAGVASFTLFAVPQTSYSGTVYLQSTQDANIGTLIVYPMDVATGKLSPAVLNVLSSGAAVSPKQSRVAVTPTSPDKTFTIYDLATGASITSWILEATDRVTSEAVRFISDDCFETEISNRDGVETRTFCSAAN